MCNDRTIHVTLQRNHLFAADEKCVEAGETVRRIVANEILAAALEDCQHANNFNTPIRGSGPAGQRQSDSLQVNDIRDARQATAWACRRAARECRDGITCRCST